MKLLILSHVSDFIGGAEKSLINIIDKWSENNPSLDIKVILRKPLGGIEKELDKRDIPYVEIDYTYWMDSNLPVTPDRIYGNALRNMEAVRSIEALIDDWNPDIVLTNSMIAPWAAIAAYFRGVPHVWMVREYGSRDHGHKFEIGEKQTFEDVGNLSELVLTNSITLADYVAQYVDNKKITTVYTPFNIASLQKSAKEIVQSPFNYESDALKVLLTGNVAPGKGHETAIKALGELKRRHVKVEICFVGREGSKEYMDKLYNLASTLGVMDSIHFVGFKSNPLAFSNRVDIAIMPSRMEAFGRVTFEYAAVGLPIVGSNSGATPEIVINGENGFLYKPEDYVDMANKIEKYVNNESLIKKHSEAAQKHAKKMMRSKYSADHAYRRIVELVGTEKTKFNYLNYSHRWMRYPKDAQAYIQYIHGASLSKILKFKAKTLLRPYYVRIKSAYVRTKKGIGKN